MRFPHDSDSDARVLRPGRLPTADASSMCPPGSGRADEDDDTEAEGECLADAFR